MAQITGIGGVFFHCKDKDALIAWYRDKLGFEPISDGSYSFLWSEDKKPQRAQFSVWGPFSDTSTYFEPSSKPFMINFRVDDLLGFVKEIQAKGVSLEGDVLDEVYGKFAWVLDPEGNKIELWEAVELED